MKKCIGNIRCYKMPYNSTEWQIVRYRSRNLIGIKQHTQNKNRFMLEVNIKALRKRKFITIDEKGEDAIRIALELYAEFKADIKEGYFLEAKSFEDIFKRMLLMKHISLRWRKLQEATYRNHIKQHIGNKNIKDIKPYDIDEVLIQARNKAPATKKGIMNIVKGALKYAQEEKLIKSLPLESRHNIRVNALEQKTLVTNPIEKYQKVHSAIYSVFEDNAAMKCIFLFGLYGRRKSEVLQMKWQHINFKAMQYVIPSSHSKIKTDFVFSLPTEIAEALRGVEATKRGLVFINPRTSKRYTNIQREIMAIRTASGWKEFTFHSMRNLLASTLHARGVNASYISSILGHTNPNTVKQYLTMERTQTIIEEEINSILGV